MKEIKPLSTKDMKTKIKGLIFTGFYVSLKITSHLLKFGGLINYFIRVKVERKTEVIHISFV